MSKPTKYPAANFSQWFATRYPGDTMPLTSPVLVLHTTESAGWPNYQGGAVAPTFTVWPGHGVRQHFPVNQSARALVNAAGGVQTNTQGAIQVELVGTCATGGPGLYWPNATDTDMTELVALVRWLHTEWGLKLASTVTWKAYPGSYGLHASQRLTGAQWTAYAGICGHEHVPENLHGDPGAFPVSRLLRLAATTPIIAKKGTTSMTTEQKIARTTWQIDGVLPAGSTERDKKNTAWAPGTYLRQIFERTVDAKATINSILARQKSMETRQKAMETKIAAIATKIGA